MTEPRRFLLRYVGARFEGHRLPLDILPDLSAFRDLLVSYVKSEWRAAHAERERLPKGFEKSIAFDLVGIKDGSAVPQLEWDRDTAQLPLPDFKDELELLVEKAYAKGPQPDRRCKRPSGDHRVDVREHPRVEQVRIQPTPERED